MLAGAVSGALLPKFSSRISESMSLLISTGVFFFHENTDHITGVHKTNQREEYLDGTVDDLQVLEVHDAARDGHVRVVIHHAMG